VLKHLPLPPKADLRLDKGTVLEHTLYSLLDIWGVQFCLTLANGAEAGTSGAYLDALDGGFAFLARFAFPVIGLDIRHKAARLAG